MRARKFRSNKKFRWDEILSRLDLTKPIIGAEIGVAQGGMSAQLLRCPMVTLYMVDVDFRGAGHNTDFAGDRARITKGKSPEAAEWFPDHMFDFVFIDADHSFVAVVKDIISWRPKVKHGGLLCGHDYGVDAGVAEAVDLFFPDRELGEDFTWFVRRP
jgi:predicted O-methyltransferase YrrM